MSHGPAPRRPGGERPSPLRRTVGSQQFAFLAVGAANAVIGLAAFAAFYALLGESIGYLGSLLLAYAAALVCGCVLHRELVFKVRGHFLVDLARFTLVNLAALGLNAVLLPLFVEVVGLPVLPAQLVALALVVVFNYFAHLYFSFRRVARPTVGSHAG